MKQKKNIEIYGKLITFSFINKQIHPSLYWDHMGIGSTYISNLQYFQIIFSGVWQPK